jgi:hypothetical protein
VSAYRAKIEANPHDELNTAAIKVVPASSTLAPIIRTVGPIIRTLAPIIRTLAPIIRTLAPIIRTVGPIITTVAPIIRTVGTIIRTLGPLITTVVGSSMTSNALMCSHTRTVARRSVPTVFVALRPCERAFARPCVCISSRVQIHTSAIVAHWPVVHGLRWAQHLAQCCNTVYG